MSEERRSEEPQEDREAEAPVRRGRFGERYSKSAAEAFKLEMARIWAMTPRERMIEALDLGVETEALVARLGRSQR